MNLLLNPKKYQWKFSDDETAAIMRKTIEFFENKGLEKIKEDDHERTWYADFLEFVKNEKVFATLLTPRGFGDENARWDTYRNCAFNEILGFYGLSYWYTWQVSMLGVGPIWLGENELVKKQTAKLLSDGEIFAFGLSEKEHGADIYSSDMIVEKSEDIYSASGRKYYIGNANKAALVSTFGKFKDSGEYVFFVAKSGHENYHLIQNVVNSQNYVAEYELDNYPLTKEDILAEGPKAWDCALNTINFCKYNLGWASIGICTHAFYEAIDHASKRKLFNSHVTDFIHIKQLFVDAYARLSAMKLFALRASDYMRSASSTDRRYLLFIPMVKMKVTTQGEEVINNLWDIIAAKGFEKHGYFEMAARDIRCLPKLEGTVHVNMALIVKFMANYFFKAKEFPEIPTRNDTSNDEFLFNQGPTKGLSKIKFHDYRKVYDSVDLANINVFKGQIKVLKTLLVVGKPNKKQIKDIDFLLVLGELFTLVVYGQLIIENSKLLGIDDDLLDQIFDFMIRDFSKFALQLFSKTSSTQIQKTLCLAMIRKPVVDEERFGRVCHEVYSTMTDSYTMND
ncbi:MAG: acyl-CoA dehydrogenase [Bacteriovoracaceae bacterium]|nr:acyl-CoA dehydrogenase [Bacteriovoracaceae bacterium]